MDADKRRLHIGARDKHRIIDLGRCSSVERSSRQTPLGREEVEEEDEEEEL